MKTIVAIVLAFAIFISTSAMDNQSQTAAAPEHLQVAARSINMCQEQKIRGGNAHSAHNSVAFIDI